MHISIIEWILYCNSLVLSDSDTRGAQISMTCNVIIYRRIRRRNLYTFFLLSKNIWVKNHDDRVIDQIKFSIQLLFLLCKTIEGMDDFIYLGSKFFYIFDFFFLINFFQPFKANEVLNFKVKEKWRRIIMAKATVLLKWA